MAHEYTVKYKNTVKKDTCRELLIVLPTGEKEYSETSRKISKADMAKDKV